MPNPRNVHNAKIYRPLKDKPNMSEKDPIAEAEIAHVYRDQPRVNQPFKLANGATQADFHVGDRLFLVGDTEDDGRHHFTLTVVDVRDGGKDVVLECNAVG